MLLNLRNDFYGRYAKGIKSTSTGLENFQQLQLLGEGSFGRVVLVQCSQNNHYYAMKILDKTKIVKLKQTEHSLNEKKLLEAIRFPFIISLEFCFKDYGYIYFIMPFIQGGDMFIHLRKIKKFDEKLSKFYGAQILLALEYMHFCDILYRDLKPENVLVDMKGYIKIGDLGFAKIVKGRTWTLCGTPEYIAPEIILSRAYGASVDWWSFGILLYEMNAGFSPFKANDAMKTYDKIVIGKFKTPSHFSFQLIDIIKNLLQVDLTKRFGSLKNGVLDIKEHIWFRDVIWLDIYYQKVEPTFKPHGNGETDISNFQSTTQPLTKQPDYSEEQYKAEFELF